MKKILAALFVLFIAANGYAQDSWTYQKEKDVNGLKATVQITDNGEMMLLVPDDNANARYTSQYLPKEYRVNGLHVTIDGYTGKIPPNVRMMGTPLRITKIWVSKTEKKKHKLSKCKYTLKA